MAAIDFPASPTVGQKFSAANGVEYTWNGVLWVASAGAGGVTVSDTPPSNPQVNQLWFNSLLGTLFVYYNDGNTTQWVPASPNMFVPTTPGGDFFATGTSAITSGASTVVFPTVVTGNSGGWLNTTNGRYTPPAGRYHISAGLQSSSSSAGITVTIRLRKNGATIFETNASAEAAYFWAQPQLDGIFDANGTDWFDIQGVNGADRAMINWFTAYPISGVKGPTGDVGTLVPKVTKFLANGTYTPDPNMVHGYAVAKGGGGGSATFTADPAYASGVGGGGEGATATKYFKAGDYTGAQTVTVGVGGAASSTGGTSSIGAWLSASGGLTSVGGHQGGMGGATGTGDIVIPGASGVAGMYIATGSSVHGIGGAGGGAGGGRGGIIATIGAVDQGVVGVANSGGGGGGPASKSAGPGGVGGSAGGSGLVYVIEYVRGA